MPPFSSVRFVTANAATGQAGNTPAVKNSTTTNTLTFTNCNCTSGSANLTRAAGGLSALTTGSLLTGTIAARFPSNSYVFSITNDTTVVIRNGTTSALALSNGTGTESCTFKFYPPPPAEDSLYPMANLVIDDRYAVYKHSGVTGSGLMMIDIDLGSSKSIAAAGIYNMRVNNGLVNSGTLTIYSEATSLYVPGDWTTGINGPWASYATCSYLNTSADFGIQFNAPLSARFWRLQFSGAMTGDVTLGKVLLGSTLVDLGKMFSNGTTESVVRARARATTMNGATVVYELGRSHRSFALNMSAMDNTTAGLVRTVAQTDTRPTIGMLLPDDTMTTDQLFEVVVGSDDVQLTKRFGSPGLQDCTINVEACS